MIKSQLDNYVLEYETSDFIKSDPVQFIHRFTDINDIEIAGFIASMFAYGKRELFIEKLNYIFNLMENKPFDFVSSFEYRNHNLLNCDYRFSKDCDFVQIIKILNVLYSQNSTIGELFEQGYCENRDVWGMFEFVVDYFYSNVEKGKITNGFYHLLPNPRKKSALKRLNMLLRWFVRQSCVDKGIWKFVPTSELLIPLDTHVAKISRKLGLLRRNDNGYASVIEITQNLRKFDPIDPVKYDFALFGYGVNNQI